MIANLENELKELKFAFPKSQISHWSEGGVDFFLFEKIDLIDDAKECILQVGKFLGYESRVFFPKILNTKSQRKWNSQNVAIRDRKYFAFSYRVQGGSLLDIFMSHIGGLH